MLCAVLSLDGRSLITGGEDGKVRAISADGAAAELGDIGRKWVSNVAAGPQGAVAWSSGRKAWVRGWIEEMGDQDVLASSEANQPVKIAEATALFIEPRNAKMMRKLYTADD